jgi:hypothetical protein
MPAVTVNNQYFSVKNYLFCPDRPDLPDPHTPGKEKKKKQVELIGHEIFRPEQPVKFRRGKNIGPSGGDRKALKGRF